MAAPKVVNGLVETASHQPRAGVLVRAILSQGATVAGTSEVVPLEITTVTAPDGTYSLSLYSNSDLTPAGTYYTVREDVHSGAYYEATIVVPSSAGPFVMSNIQVAPPAPAPPAALDSAVVHLANPETITGQKTFSQAPIVPASSFPESAVTSLPADLASKAADNAVVHNTGAEAVAGVKTFSSPPVVPAAAFPESAVASLTTDLAAKAIDTAVVHLAGTETMTGDKVHSGRLTLTKDFVHSVRTATEAELVSGLDASLAETVYVALTANRVMGAPINPVAGHRMKVVFTEDATGGRTVTLPSAVVAPNWAMNLGANANTELPLEYNGTTSKWLFAANPPSGSTLTPPIVVPATANAPQSYRLMGGTTSGAPSAGTWNAGDEVPSQDGNLWICKGFLYPATILAETGLLAYYRMDDAGTTLVDQKGLGNGTLHGGVTTGAVGATTDGNAAMAFNGTNAYVDSFPAGLTLATFPLSIECWSKNPAFDSDRFIFGNTDNGITNINYAVDVNAAGSVRFRAGSGASLTKTVSGIDDGTYHHWLFTVSAAGALSIFRDGALVAGPSGAATPNTSGVSLSVGRTGPRNANYCNGSVDEFAVYNVELTAAQALAHYNAGVASFFYKFVRPGEVDATVVHLAGAETISGIKTFTPSQIFSAIPTFSAGLGTQSGTFLDQGGEVVNVKNVTYGAIGDGVADDTTAINNAFAAFAAAGNALCYIPKGNYKHTAVLSCLGKDVIIGGAGPWNTVLKPTAFGGSSFKTSQSHAIGTMTRDLSVVGPGTYTVPTSNPGQTAGINGPELANGSRFWNLEIHGVDKAIVNNAAGGHTQILEVDTNGCYYGYYWQTSGLDDLIAFCNSIETHMFACFAKAGNSGQVGFAIYRSHVRNTPFGFYEESGADTTFMANCEIYHCSFEVMDNGLFYSENAPANGNINGLYVGGVSGLFYQYTPSGARTDKPKDYAIVMGSANTGWEVHGLGLPTHRIGAISAGNITVDAHFYFPGSFDAFLVVASSGTGAGWKLHKSSIMSVSSNFANGSANNATKVIGGNNYVGPPASLTGPYLQITSDGGQIVNLIPGAILSSPILPVPEAPVAALITSAGNIDAGSHAYCQVYSNGGLNGRAGTTAGGAASNAVTNDASHAQNTVTLATNIAQPVGAPTVTVSIYRNKVADQTHFFLVQSGIALGTVSITDNLADASLGAAMPTVDSTAGWQSTVTLRTPANLTAQLNFIADLQNN